MKKLVLLFWIFLPGTYTHIDGHRVTQYQRKPTVEGLPDPRQTTWSYSRRYTNVYDRWGGYSSYQTSYPYGPEGFRSSLDSRYRERRQSWVP